MPRKLERDFIASNLASLNGILAKAPARSLTRESLESIRDEFENKLRSVEESTESRASTALFFSGKPVSGTRGIESEFASNALWSYQEIVTKLFALRIKGQLGERGVVPERDRSRLHVTNLVRGSFGFLLEDVSGDDEEAAPLLKGAADDSARLLGTFAEEDEEHFETAIVDIDNRVLQTVRSFFDTMSKYSATVRIVSGDSERRFDMNGILRATARANATKVEEVPDSLVGFLQGVMPDKHEFELRTEDGTISGKILGSLPTSEFESLYRQNVIADFTRTDVYRGEQVVRQKFVMIGVRPQSPSESQ
jgi:hypothetical protein